MRWAFLQVVDGPVAAFRIASFTASLLFGLYLGYLRSRLLPGTASKTGRWCLSVLSWLFLLNSVTYGAGLFVESQPALLTRSLRVLDLVTPNLALVFGLLFPRVRFPPAQLRFAFAGVACLLVAEAIAVLWVHTLQVRASLPQQTASLVMDIIVQTSYLIGWFIPLYLWLPQYASESNPSARLVLAVASWGFLAYPLLTRWAGLFAAALTPGGLIGYSASAVLQLVLASGLVALLLRVLWRRRGRWGQAEWVHATFLAFCAILSFSPIGPLYYAGPLAGRTVMGWLAWEFPWTMLRPALLSIALLTLQVMAPGIAVDRDLGRMATAVASAFAGAMVWVIVGGPIGIGAGVAVGVFTFPLAERAVRKLMRRVKVARPPESLNHIESLELYQLLVQMTVVRGRIVDPEDEQALLAARRRLNVNDREHAHFLTELRDRAPVFLGRASIQDLFVLKDDGELLCRAGPQPSDPADREMLEGALSVIQAYAPAIPSGERQRTTVGYGDRTILLVAQEPLILAALVDGRPSESITEVLDDWLDILRTKYRTAFRSPDEGMEQVQRLETDVRRMFGWSKALLG